MNVDHTLNCKSCWWQEGGKCYVGKEGKDYFRDEKGYSNVIAENRCEKYISKREYLTRAIPTERLVIISELKERKIK